MLLILKQAFLHSRALLQAGVFRQFDQWFGHVSLLVVILTLTGCSLLHLSTSQSNVDINSLQFKTNAPSKVNAVTLTVLQSQVMRFADTYVATVAQAADDFSAQVGTPKARLGALKWKLGQATAAYTDATGENPVVNTLDMVVLVSVSRMVMEDNGVGTFGDAALPMVETQRGLETNVWEIASGILKPGQQKELRQMIQDWRQKNPHQRYVSAVRFREFATALGRPLQESKPPPNSIFSLLFIDPLAGLDPTAAALEQSHRLGERAMYYVQRMPTLINWQTEALVYQLAVQPESRQVLSNADQLAASAEIFAKTAQQLPQLLDNLSARNAQFQQTLAAGRDTATAINAGIKSLDEFVRFVTPTNTASHSTNRPFNVLDYGTAAAQIGDAAAELNAVLTNLNQNAPMLTQISRQTAASADRVVHHAFWLGLVLILVLLAGSVLAGLAYRILSNRLSSNEPNPSKPASKAL